MLEDKVLFSSLIEQYEKQRQQSQSYLPQSTDARKTALNFFKAFCQQLEEPNKTTYQHYLYLWPTHHPGKLLLKKDNHSLQTERLWVTSKPDTWGYFINKLHSIFDECLIYSVSYEHKQIQLTCQLISSKKLSEEIDDKNIYYAFFFSNYPKIPVIKELLPTLFKQLQLSLQPDSLNFSPTVIELIPSPGIQENLEENLELPSLKNLCLTVAQEYDDYIFNLEPGFDIEVFTQVHQSQPENQEESGRQRIFLLDCAKDKEKIDALLDTVQSTASPKSPLREGISVALIGQEDSSDERLQSYKQIDTHSVKKIFARHIQINGPLHYRIWNQDTNEWYSNQNSSVPHSWAYEDNDEPKQQTCKSSFKQLLNALLPGQTSLIDTWVNKYIAQLHLQMSHLTGTKSSINGAGKGGPNGLTLFGASLLLAAVLLKRNPLIVTENLLNSMTGYLSCKKSTATIQNAANNQAGRKAALALIQFFEGISAWDRTHIENVDSSVSPIREAVIKNDHLLIILDFRFAKSQQNPDRPSLEEKLKAYNDPDDTQNFDGQSWGLLKTFLDNHPITYLKKLKQQPDPPHAALIAEVEQGMELKIFEI